MEAAVKVVMVNKFTSKKGNPCAFVFVSEDNGVPFRVLVYDKDLVGRLPQVGQTVKLRNGINGDMFGTLELVW